MYFNYSDEDLRSYCRNCIESLELWARRLIDEQMSACFGVDYFDAKDSNGDYIIKKKIREQVEKLKDEEPHRFPRLVDTLFIKDIIYFLCHPKFYTEIFKMALDFCYPLGREEVRIFLERIIPVRNALSHANPISIRQAEQAVCYSNDFIDSVKQYFKKVGKEQMWNVPTIIRLTDSLGNTFLNKMNYIKNVVFHVGETYRVTAEIDSSFPRESYSIRWLGRVLEFKESLDSTQFVITFSNKDVNQALQIRCMVTSKEDWHKHGTWDDSKTITLTVLP